MDSVRIQKENVLLKKKVSALRHHVDKLEETIKTKDLEAAVWKLRAQELEEELRKYKGRDDDNSTTEPRLVDPIMSQRMESTTSGMKRKVRLRSRRIFLSIQLLFQRRLRLTHSKKMIQTNRKPW